MTQTFCWVVQRLTEIGSDATEFVPTISEGISAQLRAVREVASDPPVSDAAAIRPESADIRSLRTEGYPWTVLAPVAEEIRLADRSLDFLARELVWPDPDLRSRLFHLAVLGLVLRAALRGGGELVSVSPLSGSRTGPAYRIQGADHRMWDLWFEAAGVWSYYGRKSPYGQIVRGLRGRTSALSPDIALMCPDQSALLLECKYSSSPDYIGRVGITQVAAYASEFRTKLVPDVVASVVAPVGSVLFPASEPMISGRIGVVDPSSIDDLVSDMLGQPKLDHHGG